MLVEPLCLRNFPASSMKARPTGGGLTLNIAAWGPWARALVWISIMALFPGSTEAGQKPSSSHGHHTICLIPNPQVVCETQTVVWPPTNAQYYTVIIVDSSDQGTLSPLFQTTLPSPATSVEWLVNATDAASLLHLSIFTPLPTPNLGMKPYLTTDFQVDPGFSTCITAPATVSYTLLCVSVGIGLTDNSWAN